MSSLKFEFLKAQLTEALTKPLPGYQAHIKLSPVDREPADKKIIQKSRPAAVMILIYQSLGEPKIVLIQRPDYEGTHGSQISFPGGKPESSDKNLLETAIRETHEEIGILLNEKNYLGPLSNLYIPPSNFLVSPYLSFLNYQPKFIADPLEVKEILEIPLEFFFSENAIQKKDIKVRNRTLKNIPSFVWNEKIIWGATAAILYEFLTIIRKTDENVN